MERRSYLRTAGVGTAALLVGGGALAAGLTDDASAEPTATLALQNDPVSISGSSKSGTVDSVDVTAAGDVTWEQFSQPIQRVSTALEVSFDGWTAMDEDRTTDPSGGSASLDLAADLTTHGGWGFDVPGDGTQRSWAIDARVTADVVAESESAAATEPFTVHVEVTNEPNDPSATIDATVDGGVVMADGSGG